MRFLRHRSAADQHRAWSASLDQRRAGAELGARSACAWRVGLAAYITFLLGFVLARVRHYFRSRVAESPVFEDRRAASPVVAASVRQALTAFARLVFIAFGVTMIWTVASYVFLNYVPTYATRQLYLGPAPASTSLAAPSRRAITRRPAPWSASWWFSACGSGRICRFADAESRDGRSGTSHCQ